MKRIMTFLARLYPSTWRKRYGAEFDALLEDATPKPHDAFDILWGAFRMQISTWTFGRITLACALIGVLAALAISLTLPAHYVSEATIRITPEQIPESGAPAAANQLMWDQLLSIDQEIRSRNTLTAIIQRYDLYPRERTRMPLLDVVEMMHKDILVAPLVPANSPNRVIPAFLIQFDYPDALGAQRVTADLMSRFIDASIRENAIRAQGMNRNVNEPSGMRLEPLDTASLPISPAGPNRATIAGVGLFAGLLAGLTLAFVIRSRRRTTVCPACGQRVRSPLGAADASQP
jgi:uncharacterized protein involved in exopolysaccharide biosynthesis